MSVKSAAELKPVRKKIRLSTGEKAFYITAYTIILYYDKELGLSFK